MAFSAPLSHVVLVITAAVLFYVALTDFKQFKIRNELILVLAGLFVVHAILSGRWVSAHWNLAFAALMFCAEWVAHESRLGPHPPWPEQDPPYHANPSETPPTFAAARARFGSDEQRGGRAAIRRYVLGHRRTQRPAHASLHSANSRRCKPRARVNTLTLQEIKIRLRAIGAAVEREG